MAQIPRTSGVFSLGALGGDVAASGDADWSDVTLLLDGDNNLTDRSGNTSMAWSGSASYNSGGKHGAALSFGASGTHVQGPTGANTSSFQFGTDPFTIETWIYLNATPAGDDFIFCPRGSYLDTSSFVWFVRASGSNAQLTMYSYNSYWYVSSSTFAPQTWTHIAVTRDTNKHFKFYINGQLVDTLTNQTTRVMGHTSTAPIRIGNGENGTQGLNGLLDDFRVTKGVARDIAADWTAGVYNSALPQVAAVAGATRPTRRWGGMTGRSLVESTAAVAGDANWDDVVLLLDGSGGGSATITDLSAAGNDMTNNASSVANLNTAGPYSGASQDVLDFDGSTADYLVGASGDLAALDDGQPWTIEGWVKLDASDLQGVFGVSASASATEGITVRWNVNQWQWWVNGFNNQGSFSRSHTTNWQHVALVYNGAGSSTLYIDGNPSTALAKTCALGANDRSVVGRTYAETGTEELDGKIVDFRVTHGVARYTGTFTPPTEALPQGASVAASTNVPTTGVLSLAEHYQGKL